MQEKIKIIVCILPDEPDITGERRKNMNIMPFSLEIPSLNPYKVQGMACHMAWAQTGGVTVLYGRLQEGK